MKILLAEDHLDYAANIIDYLANEGHQVDHAVDGNSARSIGMSTEYDALIFDLGLPRLDGLDLCRSIRQERPTAPILVLTSRESIDDKAAAFEAGADDYVVKGCELREIELRLLALVRRSTRSADPHSSPGATPWVVSDLSFDPATQQIRRGERPIQLHRIGRELLALLMRRSPELVSREEMEQEIWHNDPPGSEVIRTHIHSLRRAIEEPDRPRLIETVRGSGYRVIDPSDQE